jgi:hypothetical protein
MSWDWTRSLREGGVFTPEKIPTQAKERLEWATRLLRPPFFRKVREGRTATQTVRDVMGLDKKTAWAGRLPSKIIDISQE